LLTTLSRIEINAFKLGIDNNAAADAQKTDVDVPAYRTGFTGLCWKDVPFTVAAKCHYATSTLVASARTNLHHSATISLTKFTVYCWEGNISSEPCGGNVTGMSVATRNKGRLTFIITFPKKKNNILLSLCTCCLEWKEGANAVF